MRINWFFINGYHKNEKEKKKPQKGCQTLYLFIFGVQKKKHFIVFSFQNVKNKSGR